MYSKVYDSTWSSLYTILPQSYTLALETDRMQRVTKCVPRGDLWVDCGMPPVFFFFLSVLCVLRMLRILRTDILEDRRVDHESVSSGKAPAMQVSAYAAYRTPALHAIGAL